MKTIALRLGAVLALGHPFFIVAQAPAPATPAAASTATTPSGAADMRFATPVYDFGKASAGELVKYQYVFTNVGDATLTITDVHPSCGCTTAGEYSRQVEPGKTGVIPIQFNSGAYNGPVMKTITVTSNDKLHPTFALQLKGTVWKPIEVTPQNAVLNIAEESPSNATTVVRIINHMDQPLTLGEPESNNKAFTAELKTVEPGKEFQLIVKTVSPLGPGNVQGMITLKSSAAGTPTLNVMAIAMVQPAIVVSPPQMFLPAGPLGGNMNTMVSIRNSGTNSLTLSDAAVNVQGVDVQVKETEPGRQFNLTVVFPSGFDTGGTNVALTVKTSHPKFPLITVPVRQQARPVNVAARAIPTRIGPTNRPPGLPLPPPAPALPGH